MFISSDKVVSVFTMVQWFLDKIAAHHARSMKKQMDKMEKARALQDAHLEEGRKAVDLCGKLKNL